MRWLRAALGSLMACAASSASRYAAMMAVLHPERMPEPVVHFLSVRLDTFGAVCFAISFVTQCALGITRIAPASEDERE